MTKALGYSLTVDATNKAFRATFSDAPEDDTFDSGHGLARVGVRYCENGDVEVCWVEVYDQNKTTLIHDWVEMGIDQALGGADDYWKPSFEIVPIVRSPATTGDDV